MASGNSFVCGRFAFFSPAESAVHLFDIEAAEDLPPRYNIAPTQAVPVVRRQADGKRQLGQLHWGLVPFWAKEKAIGNRMINARAETVASKPAFRNAFRKKRCLVLADGFYEWQKQASGKQPWFMSLKSDEPFAMAGLWETWRESEDADPLESCTIVTTGPNEFMARLHNRMPVILPPQAASIWLDPATDNASLQSVLVPAEEGLLRAVEVSRRVNSPANEGPELILPVTG